MYSSRYSVLGVQTKKKHAPSAQNLGPYKLFFSLAGRHACTGIAQGTNRARLFDTKAVACRLAAVPFTSSRLASGMPEGHLNAAFGCSTSDHVRLVGKAEAIAA